MGGPNLHQIWCWKQIQLSSIPCYIYTTQGFAIFLDKIPLLSPVICRTQKSATNWNKPVLLLMTKRVTGFLHKIWKIIYLFSFTHWVFQKYFIIVDSDFVDVNTLACLFSMTTIIITINTSSKFWKGTHDIDITIKIYANQECIAGCTLYLCLCLRWQDHTTHHTKILPRNQLPLIDFGH